jgi:hypothetical protein
MRIEDMLKVGQPSVSKMLPLMAVAARLGMTGCGGGGSDSGTSPSSASAPASAPSGSQSAPTASAEAPAESAPEAPAGSGGTGTTAVVNLPGGTPNLTPIVPVYTPPTDAEVNEIRIRDFQAIKGTYRFEFGDSNAELGGYISVQASDTVQVSLFIYDRVNGDHAIGPVGLLFPGRNGNLYFQGLNWNFINSATYSVPGHRNYGADFKIQGRFLTGGRTPRIEGTIEIMNASASFFEIAPGSGSSTLSFTATCSQDCGSGGI